MKTKGLHIRVVSDATIMTNYRGDIDVGMIKRSLNMDMDDSVTIEFSDGLQKGVVVILTLAEELKEAAIPKYFEDARMYIADCLKKMDFTEVVIISNLAEFYSY